jgi:hypothetical protein
MIDTLKESWAQLYTMKFVVSRKVKPVNVLLQGVIGDTFHASSASDNAATADSPKASLVPLAVNDLIYPVYPDSAYELPSLFEEPAFAFSASFTRDVINQHKLAAAKLMVWS